MLCYLPYYNYILLFIDPENPIFSQTMTLQDTLQLLDETANYIFKRFNKEHAVPPPLDEQTGIDCEMAISGLIKAYNKPGEGSINCTQWNKSHIS